MKECLNYDSVVDMINGMKRGDFDQTKLKIEVDNDGVFFGLWEDFEDEESFQEITITFGGNGYQDVRELYAILFPLAEVYWV